MGVTAGAVSSTAGAASVASVGELIVSSLVVGALPYGPA
jgi:hypothetical protein